MDEHCEEYRDPFEGMTPEQISRYKHLHATLVRIMLADDMEIQPLVQTALNRYRQLFPDWEIGYYAFEKGKDRNRQIDWIIKELEESKIPQEE